MPHLTTCHVYAAEGGRRSDPDACRGLWAAVTAPDGCRWVPMGADECRRPIWRRRATERTHRSRGESGHNDPVYTRARTVPLTISPRFAMHLVAMHWVGRRAALLMMAWKARRDAWSAEVCVAACGALLLDTSRIVADYFAARTFASTAGGERNQSRRPSWSAFLPCVARSVCVEQPTVFEVQPDPAAGGVRGESRREVCRRV